MEFAIAFAMISNMLVKTGHWKLRLFECRSLLEVVTMQFCLLLLAFVFQYNLSLTTPINHVNRADSEHHEAAQSQDEMYRLFRRLSSTVADHKETVLRKCPVRQ